MFLIFVQRGIVPEIVYNHIIEIYELENIL